MAVTLTSDALVTLAVVKDELGITGGAEDDRLKRMINAVSRRIRSYCHRTFHYEEDIVESVAGFGGTLIRLSRRPIVSVSSVTYDDAEISSDDYTIQSASGMLYRSTGWVWTARLQRNSVADPQPGSERAAFEVTYTGGYVTEPQVDDEVADTKTLPDDLEDACLMAVVTRYRGRGQDQRIKSERSLTYSVAYTDGAELLSPAVKEMLAPYREVVVV